MVYKGFGKWVEYSKPLKSPEFSVLKTLRLPLVASDFAHFLWQFVIALQAFFLCVSGETHFPKMGETHFPNAETHFQNHKTHFRGIFTQVGLYLTYIRHTADHKNAHTKTQSLHSSSLSMRDETHFHSTSAKLISKMPKLISKTLKLISEIAETHFQKAETHFRGILVEWPWLDFAQKKACWVRAKFGWVRPKFGPELVSKYTKKNLCTLYGEICNNTYQNTYLTTRGIPGQARIPVAVYLSLFCRDLTNFCIR